MQMWFGSSSVKFTSALKYQTVLNYDLISESDEIDGSSNSHDFCENELKVSQNLEIKFSIYLSNKSKCCSQSTFSAENNALSIISSTFSLPFLGVL